MSSALRGSHRVLSAVALLPLLLLPTHALASEVYVVDAAGGSLVDFTSLQAAVDAASDGDMLLVHSGDYEATVVSGKGLAIFANGGDAPRLAQLTIRNLPAGSSLVMRGLDGDPAQVSGVFVSVLDADGPVLVEDGRFVHEGAGGSGSVGVRVQRSEHVALVRCTIAGASGGAANGSGAPALWVNQSSVTVYGSVLTGGCGVAQPGAAGHGGPALRATSSVVFSGGSSLLGGAGAPSQDATPGCHPAGDGGAGVDADGLVHELDCVVMGGQAGLNMHAPGCPDGQAGAAMTASTAVDDLPGKAYGVQSPALLRELQTGTLSIKGAPGDLVLVVVSAGLDPMFLAAHGGVLLPQVTLLDAVGYVSDAGVMDLPVSVPLLPPGIDAVSVCLQGGLADGASAARLAEPSAMVLLDASF